MIFSDADTGPTSATANWASHRDHQPDWRVICDKVASDPAESDALLTGLKAFATRLNDAPALAAEMGAHVEIRERAMSRCIEITDSVLAE